MFVSCGIPQFLRTSRARCRLIGSNAENPALRNLFANSTAVRRLPSLLQASLIGTFPNLEIRLGGGAVLMVVMVRAPEAYLDIATEIETNYARCCGKRYTD